MKPATKLSLGVCAVAVTGIALYAAGARINCAYSGWSMERETKYAPLVGCLVKAGDSKWSPLSSLREVE